MWMFSFLAFDKRNLARSYFFFFFISFYWYSDCWHCKFVFKNKVYNYVIKLIRHKALSVTKQKSFNIINVVHITFDMDLFLIHDRVLCAVNIRKSIVVHTLLLICSECNEQLLYRVVELFRNILHHRCIFITCPVSPTSRPTCTKIQNKSLQTKLFPLSLSL